MLKELVFRVTIADVRQLRIGVEVGRGLRRFAPGFILVFAVAILVAPASTGARRARAERPRRVWVTDGTVFALAATAQGVFAGGDFSLVGPQTGTWVSVSGRGAVRPASPPLGGEVAAAASDGRGGWYLGGHAFSSGDSVHRGLIHLRADGRLDQRWRPHVKGAVFALARVRSTLYVGGDFTEVAGKERLRLAAFDVKTGLLKRWKPRVIAAKKYEEPFVDALKPAKNGKTIYVGGSLHRLGHKGRANVAALDARTGSVRAWHPKVDGTVTTLAIDPRGRRIYVGGDFGKADGFRRAGLAAFDLRKAKLMPWDPDCDGYVSQIVAAPTGSRVYVAGEFASIGEKSRRGLAAVDSQDGAATPWDPNVGGAVSAMLLSPRQHTLYFGGEFESVGDADRSNLAAVDTVGGEATSWNPQAIGTVGVLAGGPRGLVGVGGTFSSVGAARRPRLAMFRLDGSLSPWAPAITGTAVHALAASPDGTRVYVGGRFTLADRTPRSLAVIDPAAPSIAPWGPPANSAVWALAPAPDGSTVYVGGAFTSAGGRVHRRLAAVDASGAIENWNPGANGLVRQLVVSGDELWAAGDFGSVTGTQHEGAASIDIASGLANGWDAGSDGHVLGLAVVGDRVFVGGEFTTIGGRSRKYLAELDAGDGSATRWDPSPDDVVNALGVSPDAQRLVVVGDFLKLSGASRDIGEFDLGTGFLTAWRPSAPFSATTLAYSPDSSTLYVGGEGVIAVYR
jgi:DNA-binding beta-propeller fold protein YncE